MIFQSSDGLGKVQSGIMLRLVWENLGSYLMGIF